MLNSKFLNRNVNTIFIMLGNECNLNCKYCLQHPLVEHPISHEINPDIYDFIEEVCTELSDGNKLRLQFFGGEPLLFWDNIKTIVTETQKRKMPVEYSLMTNGKLITQEMVDFFNKYEFWICVSWDGFNVKQTRGFDAFVPGSKQRKLLLQIERLGVSAVLSSYAYPIDICDAFQMIENAYYPIHNHHLYMNVDEIMDTGGIPQDLINFDYDRLYKEVVALTDEYLEERKNGDVLNNKYARNVYIHDKYNRLRWFYTKENSNGEYQGATCCCGNGYTTYNLGLDGTLYPCHNTSAKAGSIYDSYMSYISKIIDGDTTKERRETCRNCIAVAYCCGGCKLLSNDVRQKTYCKLKRTVFLPVLTAIQKIGEELVENNGC